jgi:serine/threonine protein kinase
VAALFRGRYAVGKYLGSGSSASVWAAVDTLAAPGAPSQVALKLFHEGKGRCSARRDEVRVCALLRRQPGAAGFVPLLLDHGTTDLVLALVAGPTIAAVRTRLSHAHIRHIIFGLLQCVAFVHRAGIVHRDVKPDNCAIQRDGTVVLMDFGLSAAVADLRAGDYVVARAYRAPELLLGMHHGTAVDAWAVGVVLLELCCGANPFAGASPSCHMTNLVAVAGPLSLPMLAQAVAVFGERAHSLAHVRPTVTSGRITTGTIADHVAAGVVPHDDDLLFVLEGLLQVDPDTRMDIASALQCPYFDSVRAFVRG